VLEPATYLHHCCSHGMPSLFPSIFTPGQFFKKKVASAHEVICEQYVLPSHLKEDDDAISLDEPEVSTGIVATASRSRN